MEAEVQSKLVKIQSGEINPSSPEARLVMAKGFSMDPVKAAKLLEGVDKSLQARSMKDSGCDERAIEKTLYAGDPFGFKAYSMEAQDKNEQPGFETKEPGEGLFERDPEAEMSQGPQPRRDL